MAKGIFVGADDVIPKSWTEVTTGTEYVASDGTKLTSSNSGYSDSVASRACDGDSATYWRGYISGCWIKLEFAEPKKISKMKTHIACWSANTADYGVPVIQGSNDDANWKTLYTIETPQTELTELTLNNVNSYKYYRIYYSNTSASSLTVLYEWQAFAETGVARKVKKAYVGVAEDSLVVNGDFSNGLEGWTKPYPASTSAEVVQIDGENCVKLICLDGSSTLSEIDYQLKNPQLDSSHIMYWCGWIKGEANNAPDEDGYTTSGLIYNGDASGGGYPSQPAVANTTTTWTKVSGRRARTTAKIYLQISWPALNNVMYFKNIKCYDLTAMYGAGNEPTKEWCDDNLEALKTLYKSKATGVARKIKKGYIGVGGVARLFYSSETLVPFTACPYASMSWKAVTANTKYQGTNDYGTWTIEASSSAGNDYSVTKAFDTQTSNYWISAAMSTDDYVSCAIYLPAGVSINPTSIYVSYGQFKNASIQGLNESTGAWETVESLSNTSSNSTTKNLSPVVTNYYKAFRVYGTRYSASYNDPRVAAFSIMTGTLKIE